MQAGTYGCYAGLQVRECVLAHFISPLTTFTVEDSGGLLGGGAGDWVHVSGSTSEA